MPDADTTTPAGAPPAPPASAVAAHVEALNMAGLAFAAKRLLGKDPLPVAGQFAMWTRAGNPGLPVLTEPLWEALAPLRIGRPAVPAAAVCDNVLLGREPDGTVGKRAAADLAAAGKTQFGASPLRVPDGESDAAALVDQVKDFWRGLASVYTAAREHVVAGDLATAVEAIGAGRRALRPIVEEIGGHARGAAGAGADAEIEGKTAATSAVEPEPPEPATPQQAAPEPAATGPLALTDEEAEAFARHQPLAEPEEEPPRRTPVEVLSSKPVRNHPFLPIIFLLAVSAVALFVLYMVVNNPANPLR